MRALTLKALPAAVAIGLALAAAAPKDAHAYAYAYSDMTISNGTVTVIPAGTTSINGFGACLSTGCASFNTPVTTSTSQATLGGSGPSLSDPLDAGVAIGNGSSFPGPVPVNNGFAITPASASNNYTWADSQIISQQTLGTPPVLGTGAPNFASTVATQQIAVGNTTGPIGTSGAATTSTTELQSGLVVTNLARLRFDLDVALQELATIVAPSTGIEAVGSGSITITLKTKDVTGIASGTPVFLWNVGSAPLGGATSGNPFGLSSVSVNTPGLQTFSNSGSFFAVTSDLAAGSYTLSVVADVEERVRSVPEPGSLALFGVALLGVFGAWRMRGRGLAV